MIQYGVTGNPGVKRGRKGGKGKLIFFVLLIVAAASVILFIVNRKGKPEKASAKEIKQSGKAPIAKSKSNAQSHRAAIIPAKAKKILAQAQEAFDKENYKDAKKLAHEAIKMNQEKFSTAWNQAANILSKTNIILFTTDIPTQEKVLYTVISGDSLDKISKKFNTTIEAIQKSNNMKPMDFKILPGQTFCIYKGDWKILTSKKHFKLCLYNGDKLFKVYPIGIGRQGRTPAGVFMIEKKNKEPDWYSRGKKYSYGSKENVLGTRWMSLKPIGSTNPNLRGYGIHGTWAPETVGKMSSNGCLRMKNEDVNELFSIVPRKTEVIIEK